jgi:hypothetical protein
MNLVAVLVLRDESKLNLGCYGVVPDLSLLLQCDVASLGIGIRAREFCGHTLEYKTVSLPRRGENQVPSDTASYRSSTDTSGNILRILKIHIQLKYIFVKHSNLSNSHDNKSKKRKPKAKKEEVELEIKEFVDCQAERVEPG